MYDLSLFIFHRDLRVNDNIGLHKALSESKHVIPLFIFTPIQISDKNKYKSSNAIQFMVESLADLDNQINKSNNKCNLWVTYGDNLNVIKKIYKKNKFQAIYFNEDYTPFAIKRDNETKKFCNDNNIICNITTDYLLLGTSDLAAKNGNRYYVFTMFYNNALKREIQKPVYYKNDNFIKKNADYMIGDINKYLLSNDLYQVNDMIAVNGGRKNGLKILKNVDQFKKYSVNRNFLSYSTTKLSAYLKFGCISVREAYIFFKTEKTGELCKGLYWRDFYYYVSIHFKQFYLYKHIPLTGYNYDGWRNDMNEFKLWKNAKTGFPVVDAAMREMNITGFMHNRGRLIVSQFLVKDLMVDWSHGEKYFSKKLVDIDRAQNLGNWNWSSSFGLDNTSFLRIFNPWTQSKEYDSNCIYIKKWLPELANVDNNHIHKWWKYHPLYDIDYPEPIIDHYKRRKEFIVFYNKYVKKN